MINLLPPTVKQDYYYARKNRQLVAWSITFVGALLGLAIITGTSLFMMNNTMDTYKTSIAATQSQLASQNIADTEKQVSNISNNLKLMVKVLSQEILFSKLLNQLGNITPSNAVLTNLSISQSESAVEITAETGNYNAATQLQINLADPSNRIFSKADIVNITCATGSQVTNTNYPCTADIRAQFTSNNPFRFIGSTGTKAGS